MNRNTRFSMKLLMIALCLFISSCTGSEGKFAAHMEKGKNYYAASKYKEAVIEFKNAAQIHQKDPQPYYHLGLAYLKSGNPADLGMGFKALSKAVELDPGLLDAHTRLGELFFLSKDLNKSAEKANLVLSKDPENLEANLLAGNIQAAKGNIKKAKDIFQRSSVSHPDSTRPLLALANAMLATGDMEGAKATLNKALTIKGDSIAPRLALVSVYMREKDLTAAEQELKEALKASPDSLPVLAALANLHVSARKYAEAEEDINKLITASGHSAESYMMLAAMYKASGSREKAREAYKKGIELSPEPLKVQKVLAGEYLDEKNIAAASELVSTILGKNQKDPEGLFLRGRLLLVEGKQNEALSDLKAYTETAPGSPFGHYYYGLASMMNGNHSQAKTEFAEALKIAPAYNEPRLMLAVEYMESAEYGLAAAEAQNIYSRNPSFPGLAFLFGDIALKQKKAGDAARFFEAHVKGSPNDAIGFSKLALAYRLLGDDKKALSNAEKALSIDPASTEVLALAVSIDLSMKDKARALQRVKDRITAHSGDPALYMLLGKVQSAAGDLNGAEQAFTKAIELNKMLYQAYVELGNIYSRKGAYEDAVKRYQDSIKVNPDALSSYMLIGLLHEKSGKYDEAAKVYKKALEIDPKFAPAANNLAWIYSEKGGNLDMALSLAETAKERLPNEPAISDTLGWLYYKKQAYLKAISLLKECSQKLPDNPVVRYHLGMAYLKKGDRALARQELKTSLSIKGDYPGADEARKALGKL